MTTMTYILSLGIRCRVVASDSRDNDVVGVGIAFKSVEDDVLHPALELRLGKIVDFQRRIRIVGGWEGFVTALHLNVGSHCRALSVQE